MTLTLKNKIMSQTCFELRVIGQRIIDSKISLIAEETKFNIRKGTVLMRCRLKTYALMKDPKRVFVSVGRLGKTTYAAIL
jgi:hypothetical protein